MANDDDGGSLPADEDDPGHAALHAGPPGATTVQSVDRPSTLTALSRDRIVNQLRQMYDTVAQQPVPDRFAELIAKLDAHDRN